MDTTEEVYALMAKYVEDAMKSADKLYNKEIVAQGRHARKNLQQIVALCKSERKNLLDTMNFLSSKRSAAKESSEG